MVAAGCLVALMTFGTRAGFGFFLEPVSATNGWGRETFALAIAIQNLMWGVGQPFVGALADRHGSTKVLIGGAAVYALGLALMPVAGTPWQFHLTAGVLVGLGGAGASFGIVMGSLGRMVSAEQRSWAFGIIVSASSLGMAVYALVSPALILAFGWQTALVILAVSMGLVVPLALTYRGDRGSAAAGGQTIGQALGEAAGHRSYWLLVAGFFVCGYHVAFIQVHLPAFVTDQGLAVWVGGTAIMLIGLLNIVGSYGAGVLGGRHSKKNLLCAIYLLRALVIAVYVTLPPSEAVTLAFAAAMGLLWLSTVPLTSGLVAVMFGPRYMSMLFGVVFLSHQMGAFLGVWLGGRLYDTLGSYDIVWWTSVALGIAAALVHWPIQERAVTRAAPAAA
jgi:MFS family permease